MKSSGGFSLVEVMCAILILGFGVAGLTEGITVALGSSKEAEIQTTASLLAQGQIENLRADGFLLAGETEGEGDGPLASYKWKQNITETKTEGLYEVTVTVQRNDQDVFELATMLFDPPLLREDQNKSGNRERDRDRERRRR